MATSDPSNAALQAVWSRDPEGHLPRAPLEVFWTLSGLCNLSCSFCMTSSGPAPKRPGLGVKERARVLRELVQARALKVYMTGGEPMILPDFWDLLEGLTQGGIFVELTTNGTRLDSATCDRLKVAGLRSLQVSLNGPDEATNAPLMGSKSLEKILAGIQRALRAGLDVHVRPTVMAENVAQLPALIERLASMGVPQIDFREVTPLGRAAAGFEGRRPSAGELEAFEKFCREWQHPVTRLDFKSWTLQFAATNQPAVCTLGGVRPATVLIDEGGNLAGCSATFYMGWKNSVLEHGLVAAWDRLVELKTLRDPQKLTGACAPCDVRDTCQGGCRAAAARLTGDITAPDPLCPRVEGPIPDQGDEDRRLWEAV